ncbi:MAG: class I SAM-dependent methyltransferase [Myxacorys californica WJT36-NPBG1]|jgi:predicted SAM-dependent methyltransferase|nr:class I SAM-dependent methyltransferase [Myxacorys californica WJT36-NPBG1]
MRLTEKKSSFRAWATALRKTFIRLKEEPSSVSDEAFLTMAYQVLFEREVDPIGVSGWLPQLQNGLPRLELVKALFSSDEFKIRADSASLHQIFHQSRLEMVQTLLPEAKIILDIGGAHHDDSRGALLNFGYPYLPEKLYIVDLPPSERMFPVDHAPHKLNYGDCEIEYVYRSMADLSCFEAGTFDLIWSGESIEHITTEEAEVVLDQVYRLLKPGGKFAFDTPNRQVTQLQCPNNYIHPEHKIEYCYEDMIELLKKHHFKVIESKGVIDFSESVHRNTFIVDEATRNPGLNDNPQNSYLFYICCVRDDT